MKKIFGVIAVLAYVATVWVANYLVAHHAPIHVGFGLIAPAGVLAAGLAFTLRDVVDHSLGRLAVIGAILAGTALSYFLGGATIPGGLVSIPIASAIAFLVSETADFSVYTPLRRKGWLPAVLASNVVGLILDSALFIYLAFGWSMTFFQGQVVGKTWMTLAAIAVLAALRHIPGRRKVALA